MNTIAITRTTRNLMSFALMAIMAMIAMMTSVHAGLARQQVAQPGVVHLEDGHKVPVWVSNLDGPYTKTMIVHLGVPLGHPDARGIEIRFLRAVTPPGCKTFTEALPQLKHLIQVEMVCDQGTGRSPDDRVMYTLSSAGVSTDATTPYRRLHRRWPTI